MQPLVENAIKHGVEPKMEGGSIHVAARVENAVLYMEVSDTGLGLPFDYSDTDKKDPTPDGNHIGNANVRDRILAIYGPAASFTLKANQPAGVIACLRLPFTA